MVTVVVVAMVAARMASPLGWPHCDSSRNRGVRFIWRR